MGGGAPPRTGTPLGLMTTTTASDVLTLTEAAALLGVHRCTLDYHVRVGHLPAAWRARGGNRRPERVVSPDALATFREQREAASGRRQTPRPTTKRWRLVNLTTGEVYAVHNLARFCREHADLFAPHPWQLARHGLYQVQAWLTGRRPQQVNSWRGWTLERPAEAPPPATTATGGDEMLADGLLTVPQAAEVLGINRSVVLRAIHDGRLAARRGGAGAWLLQRADVAAYDQRRKPRPRRRPSET